MLNFDQLKKITSSDAVILTHALLKQLDFPKGTKFKITDDTVTVIFDEVPWPHKPELMSTMTTEYRREDIVSISIFTRSHIQAP